MLPVPLRINSRKVVYYLEENEFPCKGLCKETLSSEWHDCEASGAEQFLGWGESGLMWKS